MKVTLTVDGKTYVAKVPFPGAPTVEVALPECPACKRSTYESGGFFVRGTGIRETTHDTYVADAVAVCCGKSCGTLRAKVSTIFGIEEDERVLNGRCRVY